MRGLGFRGAPAPRDAPERAAVATLPEPSARRIEGTDAWEFDMNLRAAGSSLLQALDDRAAVWGFTVFGARYRGFMSIPGAWRASVMLSDLFAATPWHTYRDTPDGNMVRTPRNAAILEAPAGSLLPAVRVWGSWALDYIWDGNCIGIYAAWDPLTGRPTGVVPVPASDVYVRMREVGEPNAGRRQYAIYGQTYEWNEIFHVMGPCEPNAVRGMGVIEAELSNPAGPLRLSAELARQAGGISSAGVPTGQLVTSNPESKPGDMIAAKAKWLEAQRTRTVAAMGPNIEFKPVAWNPEEMELVDSRKFSLGELELMFGLPVGWLGGQTSSRQYSNIEQDAVNLVKFGVLGGMYTQFEGVLTLIIPRGQSAQANRDAILRSDTLSRYQAHALATGGRAWRTPDEVRGVENLAPLGGDAALLEAKPKPAPKPAPAPAPVPNTDPNGGEKS